MAEQNGMEMLSGLLGEQGKDALALLQRMERLKRLMGTPKLPEQPVLAAQKQEGGDLFACSRNENMIYAAIPFLNREYQRDLYIMVRLMEMRRVLNSGGLEARERQEEPPHLRRRKMLQAVQTYLPQEERDQLQNILKMMDMREIMEREGLK